MVIFIVTFIAFALANSYGDIASMVLFVGIGALIAYGITQFMIKNGYDVDGVSMSTFRSTEANNESVKALLEYAKTEDGVKEIYETVAELSSIYDGLKHYFDQGFIDENTIIAMLCVKRGLIPECVWRCSFFNEHAMTKEQMECFGHWVCLTIALYRRAHGKKEIKSWFVFDNVQNRFNWVTFPYYKSYTIPRYTEYIALNGVSEGSIYHKYTAPYKEFYRSKGGLPDEQKEEREIKSSC